MYADDTTLSFLSNSLANINESVHVDLEYLEIWLFAKTNSVLTSRRQKNVKRFQKLNT